MATHAPNAYPPPRFVYGHTVKLIKNHQGYATGDVGTVTDTWKTGPGNEHKWTYAVEFKKDGGSRFGVAETSLVRA
ncbi:hypothetical protein CPB85DRAFT_1442746 [Mucidula mucida]|nr:hypothetical protein CPB85DRAFT_1442746 [Mucidula mucida]